MTDSKNSRNNPPSAPKGPAPIPLVDKVEDLPIIESIGFTKVKLGWTVVLIKSQGHEILDTEILSGPEPKAIAMENMKLAVVKRLFKYAINS
jgi:hypothetical protein